MTIVFRTRKLERVFNSRQGLIKEYGPKCARKIMIRMTVLKEAKNLACVPTDRPDRCHELKGKKSGTFAVDLLQPYRLLFEPYEAEESAKGNTQKERVTVIRVLGVEDYH